jgi:hypothetical protein
MKISKHKKIRQLQSTKIREEKIPGKNIITKQISRELKNLKR